MGTKELEWLMFFYTAAGVAVKLGFFVSLGAERLEHAILMLIMAFYADYLFDRYERRWKESIYADALGKTTAEETAARGDGD